MAFTRKLRDDPIHCVCEHCGVEFTFICTGHTPKYCSKSHANSASCKRWQIKKFGSQSNYIKHVRTSSPSYADYCAARSHQKSTLKGRKHALTHLSPEEWVQIYAIYKEMKRLNKEVGFVKYHVDHIYPIARGGKHHPDNLQILLATENLKKGAKLGYTSTDRRSSSVGEGLYSAGTEETSGEYQAA